MAMINIKGTKLKCAKNVSEFKCFNLVVTYMYMVDWIGGLILSISETKVPWEILSDHRNK